MSFKDSNEFSRINGANDASQKAWRDAQIESQRRAAGTKGLSGAEIRNGIGFNAANVAELRIRLGELTQAIKQNQEARKQLLDDKKAGFGQDLDIAA